MIRVSVPGRQNNFSSRKRPRSERQVNYVQLVLRLRMSGALPLLLCVPLWRDPGHICFGTVEFVVQAPCFPGCYRHSVCVNEDSALMYFDVS